MPWIAIELRSPGPGLRHPPGSSPGPAALQATDTGGCAPPPSPHPPDLGWSSFKRRNDTGSLRIPSRLAHRSGPSGSPEPARLCRGCFDPPRHPPGQAAASFHPTATTARRQGLSRPPETSAPRGATQRLDRLSRWVHDRRLSQPYITTAIPCRATLGRRAFPLVKACFPMLPSMPQSPLTGAGAPTARHRLLQQSASAAPTSALRRSTVLQHAFPGSWPGARLSVEHLGIPPTHRAAGTDCSWTGTPPGINHAQRTAS